MLGNLVESLKSVDRDIGDAVYYWGEFLHKRQSSEASSSSHVGRMFRSNNHAAKTKYNGDDTRDYVDKDEVKRLIGNGGQCLVVTYLNANSERKTIQATVICLNGAYLRVCEVGDVNEIAKSIRLNKLINVREG